MTEAETSERARRAAEAKATFYGPAFDVLRNEYAKRIASVAADVEPSANEKMTKLGLAIRVLDLVEAQVDAVITAGTVADRERKHAAQIERIPIEKRRIMGLTVSR